MLIILLLEMLGSGVGLYNLAKGAYGVYSDSNTLKRHYQEYQEYLEAQKNSYTPLTHSQFVCLEGEFVLIE